MDAVDSCVVCLEQRNWLCHAPTLYTPVRYLHPSRAVIARDRHAIKQLELCAILFFLRVYIIGLLRKQIVLVNNCASPSRLQTRFTLHSVRYFFFPFTVLFASRYPSRTTVQPAEVYFCWHPLCLVMPFVADDSVQKSSEWTYRVEGALHMLFAYTGSNPFLKNHVLRLETSRNTKGTRRGLEEQYAFIRAVFCGPPLAKFINPGLLLNVKERFLEELSNDAQPFRPERRAFASIVVEKIPLLLLQQDFARILNPNPRKQSISTRSSASSCASRTTLAHMRQSVPSGVCMSSKEPPELPPFVMSLSNLSHISSLPSENPLQSSCMKTTSSALDGFCEMTICVEVKPKAALTCVSRLVPEDVCNALDKFGTLGYALKNYTSPLTSRKCMRCHSSDRDENLARFGLNGSSAKQLVSSDEDALQAESDSVSTVSQDSDFVDGCTRCNAGNDDPPRYSPADLLSGEHCRILSALDALRRRRAHSLRVFYDGRVMLADDIPIDEEFASREEAFKSRYCEYAIKASARVLAKSDFAFGILETQRLDYIDALGAEKVWSKLVRVCGGDERQAEAAVWNAYFIDEDSHPDIIDKVRIARTHLSYPSSAYAREHHCDDNVKKAENYLESLETEVAARILADFMISSVIKDCSVMVSMLVRSKDYVPSNADNYVTLDDGSVCVYCVDIVDLEPKPVSKIRKWADRDRALMASIPT